MNQNSEEKTVSEKIRDDLYERMNFNNIDNMFNTEADSYARYQALKDIQAEKEDEELAKAKQRINESQKPKLRYPLVLIDAQKIKNNTIPDNTSKDVDDIDINGPLSNLVECHNVRTETWMFGDAENRANVISIQTLNPTNNTDKMQIDKGYKYRLFIQKDGIIAYLCMRDLIMAKVTARFLLIG